MNRRQFLASSAAMGLLPRSAASASPTYRLRAEDVTGQILPLGDGATRMLGFNGSMPGPELRVRQGERVRVDVENGLDEGTAVHWHGIRLENSMDGVPALTQTIIEPGDTKTYSFVPPDAGTFWYHSHYISHEQVARGLMGPLIIEDDEPIDVDHDITAILSDWRMERDGTLIEEYTDRHSVAHAGLLGTFARAFFSRGEVKAGDRIRLRLINAATNRIFPVVVSGASGRIVALDGISLSEPRDFEQIMMAPAQRVDLILDVAADVKLDMMSRQGPYELGTIAASGKNGLRKATPIAALPAHAIPVPSNPDRHLTLHMMGGAMGGRHGGANIWAFNDISDLQSDPFAYFRKGETARITLVNDTSFPHGIHLHGHHFYEVGADGSIGDLRDTTLVNARENRDILCTFDNPGKWMLHCHMLSHAFGGMRTWVEVT
ncbi:multicopper oxidase family protein [Tateyamaria omphalii]|uniref:Copper oxidase n=1 Tax=Tateyamaria omphalii TaxID=299262 RepID=A0A1P8MY51_9RHOB|nr:multicopper oxidase family protein [Tateyamaria omphalii]APX13010.1 copper oxidase [Tateyamaria omphalii]